MMFKSVSPKSPFSFAYYLSLTTISLALSACSLHGNSSGGGAAQGGGAGALGCPGEPALPSAITGGCKIRMVTPTNCQQIDLSGGKTFEFAWTTDGTGCEMPYKIIVAGHPATQENAVEITLNADGAAISRTGGLINVSLDSITQLGIKSDSGLYHWTVSSFHDSRPASQTFSVKK